MTTSDILLDLALEKGYHVIYSQLQHNLSLCIEDVTCYIALSPHLPKTTEKELLAHELGHCEYGGFYNHCSSHDIRAKAECRANKWAYAQIATPTEIRNAIDAGITEPWELAEHFDISCQYMRGMLDHYQQQMLL